MAGRIPYGRGALVSRAGLDRERQRDQDTLRYRNYSKGRFHIGRGPKLGKTLLKTLNLGADNCDETVGLSALRETLRNPWVHTMTVGDCLKADRYVNSHVFRSEWDNFSGWRRTLDRGNLWVKSSIR